jgi:hypothetical protein
VLGCFTAAVQAVDAGDASRPYSIAYIEHREHASSSVSSAFVPGHDASSTASATRAHGYCILQTHARFWCGTIGSRAAAAALSTAATSAAARLSTSSASRTLRGLSVEKLSAEQSHLPLRKLGLQRRLKWGKFSTRHMISCAGLAPCHTWFAACLMRQGTEVRSSRDLSVRARSSCLPAVIVTTLNASSPHVPSGIFGLRIGQACGTVEGKE